MGTDILKASTPSIIVYESSRLCSKFQQLLRLLPFWPECQVTATVVVRVSIIRVQRIHGVAVALEGEERVAAPTMPASVTARVNTRMLHIIIDLENEVQ